MKIRTSNLSGQDLDRAVAIAEGYKVTTDDISILIEKRDALRRNTLQALSSYSPSSNWNTAGPIIQKRLISLSIGHDGLWVASNKYNYADEPRYMHADPSPLVAAMRCYVEQVLGELNNLT